jgi:hypothetical protein
LLDNVLETDSSYSALTTTAKLQNELFPASNRSIARLNISLFPEKNATRRKTLCRLKMRWPVAQVLGSPARECPRPPLWNPEKQEPKILMQAFSDLGVLYAFTR